MAARDEPLEYERPPDDTGRYELQRQALLTRGVNPNRTNYELRRDLGYDEPRSASTSASATRSRSTTGGIRPPQVVGGVVGVGAPALLHTIEDAGTPTLHKPSVLWGVGGGALTTALYLVGVGPQWAQDVMLGHSLTAIPTGLVFAIS